MEDTPSHRWRDRQPCPATGFARPWTTLNQSSQTDRASNGIHYIIESATIYNSTICPYKFIVFPKNQVRSKGVNGGSGICASRASRAMMARSAPYDAYMIVSIGVVKLSSDLDLGGM